MQRDYQVTKLALLTLPLKLEIVFHFYFLGDNVSLIVRLIKLGGYRKSVLS